MARAEVTHSTDAVQITFRGDRRRPEPATGVIVFPGGHVEVSRCSDGSYWAHVEFVDPVNCVESRIDYIAEATGSQELLDPRVKHIAVRVANTVPHFDPDRG